MLFISYLPVSLLSQIRALEQTRAEALRELDQYQKRVRRETDEVIASLNSNRDEIDDQHKRLHELTVRAADYEVIQ